VRVEWVTVGHGCGDGGCDDGGGARARADGRHARGVMPCDAALSGGGASISGPWCNCPEQRGKDGLLLSDTVGKSPGSYVRVR
jgi:hypothetical protein